MTWCAVCQIIIASTYHGNLWLARYQVDWFSSSIRWCQCWRHAMSGIQGSKAHHRVVLSLPRLTILKDLLVYCYHYNNFAPKPRSTSWPLSASQLTSRFCLWSRWCGNQEGPSVHQRSSILHCVEASRSSPRSSKDRVVSGSTRCRRAVMYPL